MNKLISLLIGSVLVMSQPLFAQQGEPVLVNIYYRTVHVNDTNNRDKPLVEEMLLQLGQTGSKYIRAANKPVKQPSAPAASGPVIMAVGRPLAVVNGPGITEVELFQYPAEGKMNVTASLGMYDYLMELKLPKIDWKISEETRKIGGYSCQKAMGDFAGRTYSAWFTSELPFQNGPWKFSGLPGLILEIEDAKKEVQFLFKAIDKDSTPNGTATVRRKLVTVSEAAFNRAKEAYLQDPAAAMQAQLPAGAPTVEVSYRDADHLLYCVYASPS
jgi:GLPGLI family protein